MEQLAHAMRTVLADSFLMYFKAHAFHWNVEGVMFSQYHEFFGDLYEEIHASIDETAEEIRKLNYPAPFSIVELYADKSMSMPQAEVAVGSSKLMQMLQELDNDNTAVIDALNRAFTLANEANEQGLADYIASRLSAHKKHRWMIRSSMKSSA